MDDIFFEWFKRRFGDEPMLYGDGTWGSKSQGDFTQYIYEAWEAAFKAGFACGAEAV